jgi:hypothetical protein
LDHEPERISDPGFEISEDEGEKEDEEEKGRFTESRLPFSSMHWALNLWRPQNTILRYSCDTADYKFALPGTVHWTNPNGVREEVQRDLEIRSRSP